VTLLFCALAVAIAALAFDRDSRAPEVPRAVPWVAVAALALALAASLVTNEWVIANAALGQMPFPAWLRGASFTPILELEPLYAHTAPGTSLAAEGLAVLDTLLLGGLAFTLRGVPARAGILAFAFVCALASIGLSFFAPGLASSDLYAYAFYARFGTGAYHSLLVPHDGPLAIVGHLWSFRMVPSAYGPVWLDTVRILAGGIDRVDVQILVFRGLSAITLVALLAGLVALRLPVAFVALVALDPAIYLQFVVDGHNDLFGIALLVWARVAARRGWTIVAVVLAILAGASKASFLPLAALVFFDAEPLRRRVVPAACAIAGGIAASLAFGGLAYPHALAAVAAIFPASGEPGGAVLPRITTFVTIALVIAAVGWRRTGWPGSWAFVSLGSVVFPWYAIWGLPYATLDPRRATAFLATFPVTAFVLTTAYAISGGWAPLIFTIACSSGMLAYARWRSPARRLAAPPANASLAG
jgi:hypothetical protein